MSRYSAAVPSTEGPILQLDDEIIKEEEDAAESQESDFEDADEETIKIRGFVHMDQIFKFIGSYGNYQIFFFITCQLMSISNAMSMVAGFFRLGNLVPDYTCNDEGFNWTLTSKQVKANSSLACAMVTNCSNLVSVNAWYSMYEEFNWICSDAYIRSTIQSLLPILVFIGFIVSGHLSDYFGRKWLMIVGELYSVISGIACSWAPNFTVYLILNVIGALIGPISASALFSLIVESVNPKYRLIQGFSFQYSIGLMLAGGMAHLLKNWRYHMFISNLIGIPALLMMFKLEESPRFLLQQGKFKETAAALTRIAKFNGKNVVFTVRQMRRIWANNQRLLATSLQKIGTKRYTVTSLFANWKMASYAFSQILTGITMNIVNDVLFFNIQDLSGSPFLNTFLMGALRLWTPFAGYFLENGMKSVGRLRLLVISQGFVFLMFSFMFVVDFANLDSSMRAVGSIAVIVGYTFESGLVWIAYKLFTVELFPTCVRSIALSTFSSTSMLGSIITPQLTFLAGYWHPSPYAGAAIAAGLSVTFALLFLPETQMVALPDTIQQATHRKDLYKETRTFSRMARDQRGSTNVSASINDVEERKIILDPIKE